MGSMGLFPYFTKIFGKIIAWDFGSRISSKNSARISASATKISACCGPLGMYIVYLYMRMHVYIYVRMHVYIYVRMYVHMRTYVCSYVSMYVCM